MKVTLVPVQILFADGVTETAGARAPLTVMVMVFEVAEVGEAHDNAEVITQVTVFPFAKVLLVYVGKLEPTLDPLSFH